MKSLLAQFVTHYALPLSAAAVLTTGLTSASLASAQSTSASTEPIRIGVLQSLSGAFSPIGPLGVNGARLAAEGRTALNRPIELVVEDDHSDPQVGAQKARRLIDQHKVVAIEGMVGSSIGAAVSNVAASTKTPLILAGPSASELTGSKCNRQTFRVKPPTLPMVNTIVPYLLDTKGTDWYFIAYDYSWGHEGVEFAKDILEEHDADIKGIDYVPLGTQDYSSYLLKVRRAAPSVLFVMLGGNDMAALIQQFSDFGLDKTTLSSGVMDLSVAWQVGNSIAGTYPVSFYPTVKESKTFVDAYFEKYDAMPDNQAWQDYVAVSSIIDAIEQSGSTDSDQIIKQLETMKFDVHKGRKGYYRDFDHQLMQTIYVVETKSDFSVANNSTDWGDVVYSSPAADEPLDSIFGDHQSIGCEF